MLVVTVEVWPGDDPRRRQNIRTLAIVNTSDVEWPDPLPEDSLYEAWLDGQQVKGHIRHSREDGAWVLVRKVLARALRGT